MGVRLSRGELNESGATNPSNRFFQYSFGW
jgi:hypothetical protein